MSLKITISIDYLLSVYRCVLIYEDTNNKFKVNMTVLIF